MTQERIDKAKALLEACGQPELLALVAGASYE